MFKKAGQGFRLISVSNNPVYFLATLIVNLYGLSLLKIPESGAPAIKTHFYSASFAEWLEQKISVNLFLISIRTYIFLLKCTIEWAPSLKKVLVKKAYWSTKYYCGNCTIVFSFISGSAAQPQCSNLGDTQTELTTTEVSLSLFQTIECCVKQNFHLRKNLYSSCLHCFLLFVRYQQVEIKVVFRKLVTLSLP